VPGGQVGRAPAAFFLLSMSSPIVLTLIVLIGMSSPESYAGPIWGGLLLPHSGRRPRVWRVSGQGSFLPVLEAENSVLRVLEPQCFRFREATQFHAQQASDHLVADHQHFTGAVRVNLLHRSGSAGSGAGVTFAAGNRRLPFIKSIQVGRNGVLNSNCAERHW
jgi:hypothetical protein